MTFIYVGNIDTILKIDILKKIFETCGKINKLKIMTDHESKKSKGFGFVDFECLEAVLRASRLLNGLEIAECQIIVKGDEMTKNNFNNFQPETEKTRKIHENDKHDKMGDKQANINIREIVNNNFYHCVSEDLGVIILDQIKSKNIFLVGVMNYLERFNHLREDL